MGPGAMHNASTAQEVTIITPSAANFEFRVSDRFPPLPPALTSYYYSQRWGDPSPMPPSPIQGYGSPEPNSETDTVPEDTPSESSSSSRATSKEASSPTSSRGGSRTGSDGAITFDPLPKQSIRTALILDRFSTSCPIIYCSNDSFLTTTEIMGRPFFDFVAKRDESLVRSWIDAVKGWGVNERGQPSDGGFGFGKFHLFPRGRDSVFVFLSPLVLTLDLNLTLVGSASAWNQNLLCKPRLVMGARRLATVRHPSNTPRERPRDVEGRLRRRATGHSVNGLRRS